MVHDFPNKFVSCSIEGLGGADAEVIVLYDRLLRLDPIIGSFADDKIAFLST